MDLDAGQIADGETVVRVEPKVMDVLAYLAAHQGEVVSREELERQVWRGALVGYDAVTGTVIKLRKALDDDAREPRYIATIPKRGYRLLPGVVQALAPGSGEPPPSESQPGPTGSVARPTEPTPSRPPSSPARSPRSPRTRTAAIGLTLALVLVLALELLTRQGRAPEPAPLVPRIADLPSLAVLPFANLAGDPDEQYFVDGLTEDLITDLSKISGLRVIAHSSAFAFAGGEADPREAAKQLGVRYVLQGSLRRSADRLRVTAKLVDTASGARLWAEQFDGGTQDLFALQDQVAERTASALSVKLTEDEKRGLAVRPTTHFGAYDDYLRGRVIYGSLTQRENEQARTLDPEFSPQEWVGRWPFKKPEHRALLISGLEAASLK